MKKKILFVVAALLCFADMTAAQDTLIPYRIREQWGFSDMHGKLLIKPQYSSAELFSNKFYKGRFLSIVSKNGKFGIIDKQNKIVIPFAYENIIRGYDRRDWVNCFIVKKNGKYGAVSYQNKQLVPFLYDSIQLKEEYLHPETYHQYLGFSFAVQQANNYFLLKKNGKKQPFSQGEFNKLGEENWASGPGPEYHPNYMEDIRQRKAEIILNNSEIIDNISEYRGYGYHEELIAVYKNNKVGIVAQTELLKKKIEHVLIPITHDKIKSVYHPESSPTAFLFSKGKDLLLYRASGKFICTLPTPECELLGFDYVITKENGRLGYLEFDEDKVRYTIAPKYDAVEYVWPYEFLIKVLLDGKNGYTHKNGMEYFKD